MEKLLTDYYTLPAPGTFGYDCRVEDIPITADSLASPPTALTGRENTIINRGPLFLRSNNVNFLNERLYFEHTRLTGLMPQKR